MAIPTSSDARLFYRCAIQRYEEAEILFRANYTTGAVYLAGYGIECILKALILSVVPSNRVAVVLDSFRGHRAHDYEFLREQYYRNKGARFPRGVGRHFTMASYWSTNLRYRPGMIKLSDTEEFLAAVAAIIEWAEGRF